MSRSASRPPAAMIQKSGFSYPSAERAPRDRSDMTNEHALEERIATALDIADSYGSIDGDMHKMWVIDQMVRALSGDGYSTWLAMHKTGADGPETYGWDEGIAP